MRGRSDRQFLKKFMNRLVPLVSVTLIAGLSATPVRAKQPRVPAESHANVRPRLAKKPHGKPFRPRLPSAAHGKVKTQLKRVRSLSAVARPEPGPSKLPPEPSAYTARATRSIGSISVGRPNVGFLVNGVALKKDPRWGVSAPQHRWGTEETIEALTRAIAYVHEFFPHSPPVMIGSLSPEHGGYAPPHKSHRTGRDVDVYFYRSNSKVWFKPALREDIDYPRTWTLLKAFLTQTQIDYVLVDSELQTWFREYATSIGEDPAWLKQMFEGEGRYPNAAIKHAPGHTNHFHVRFASPLARERGRLLYDRLVAERHLEAVELPGAREPVVLANFPRPGEKSSAAAATLAGLSAVEQEFDEALLKLPAAPITTAQQP